MTAFAYDAFDLTVFVAETTALAAEKFPGRPVFDSAETLAASPLGLTEFHTLLGQVQIDHPTLFPEVLADRSLLAAALFEILDAEVTEKFSFGEVNVADAEIPPEELWTCDLFGPLSGALVGPTD